jgi:hypothetical protein
MRWLRLVLYSPFILFQRKSLPTILDQHSTQAKGNLSESQNFLATSAPIHFFLSQLSFATGAPSHFIEPRMSSSRRVFTKTAPAALIITVLFSLTLLRFPLSKQRFSWFVKQIGSFYDVLSINRR